MSATATTELDRGRRLLSELGFEFVPVVLPELIERSVKEEHSGASAEDGAGSARGAAHQDGAESLRSSGR